MISTHSIAYTSLFGEWLKIKEDIFIDAPSIEDVRGILLEITQSNPMKYGHRVLWSTHSKPSEIK